MESLTEKGERDMGSKTANIYWTLTGARSDSTSFTINVELTKIL